MYTVIKDFGTPELLSSKMRQSSIAAAMATPVMERIAVDMIRVTDLLWKSQGARGGGRWKKLAPKTIERKGNSKILYTAGSNPRYTPHPGEDTLAKSVTRVNGPHQVLRFTRSTVEFGTDLEYGNRQFSSRPFIRFTPTDQNRWNRWIVTHVVMPFAKSRKA